MIHDLVAAAAGVDSNRGDQLVVETFPFESTLTSEPVTLNPPAPVPSPTAIALPKWLEKLKDKNAFILIGIGAGAILVLIGGLIFMLRRSRNQRKVTVAEQAALELPRPLR